MDYNTRFPVTIAEASKKTLELPEQEEEITSMDELVMEDTNEDT